VLMRCTTRSMRVMTTIMPMRVITLTITIIITMVLVARVITRMTGMMISMVTKRTKMTVLLMPRVSWMTSWMTSWVTRRSMIPKMATVRGQSISSVGVASRKLSDFGISNSLRRTIVTTANALRIPFLLRVRHTLRGIARIRHTLRISHSRIPHPLL
jgi:hypothetical protein